MSDRLDFSDDDYRDFEEAGFSREQIAAIVKFGARMALKTIDSLINALEAVKIETNSDAFEKGAAKGIQAAVQAAEELGAMLRKMT